MRNPAAFISYARRDDAAYGGWITRLCARLQGLVGSAIGRDFEIFQDRQAIAWGQHWPTRLDEGLEEALFLIPILTPSYFNSGPCRAELETFLELERRSGRMDRVLSLYFVTAPVYEQKAADPVAAILHDRQHRDWRHLRIGPVGSPKVMRALDSLATELADAIHARQGDLSPPATAQDSLAEISKAKSVLPKAPRDDQAVALWAIEDITPLLEPGSQHTHDALLRWIDAELSKGIRNDPSGEPGTVFREINAPWCPETVVIRPGGFMMGSTEAERQWAIGQGATPQWVSVDWEKEQHSVAIPEPFAVGTRPVTLGQFAVFVKATDHDMSGGCLIRTADGKWKPSRTANWRVPGFEQTLSHPVVAVSWEDAKAYVEWLRWKTGQLYRLLSEAEWEYACRAGTTTRYAWGDHPPTPQQANFGPKVEATTRVASFPPNPWGLYDMHGNVWEWVEDCWKDSYANAPSDGTAWTSRDCGSRVLRGGAWNHPPVDLRSASRFGNKPGFRGSNIGLRVARSLT